MTMMNESGNINIEFVNICNANSPKTKEIKARGKRRKKAFFVIAVTGLVVGIGIIIYPFASDLITQMQTQEKISTMTALYEETSENEQEIKTLLYQARLYNYRLAGKYYGDESRIYPYEDQLSLEGSGCMSVLEIPCISLKMLVYHGTSEEVLQIGAGHVEKSSLPVGGKSTHCVITGHSGLQNTRAFDYLRKLKVGDTFTLTTLGQVLEYQVDGIETVLPEETESLQIVEGEDRVTLVTCTPYGINDHRLFIHAIRK